MIRVLVSALLCAQLFAPDAGFFRTLRFRNIDPLRGATHGRGFYVLDNIGPLRQATPQIARRPVCLSADAEPAAAGLAVYTAFNKALATVQLPPVSGN